MRLIKDIKKNRKIIKSSIKKHGYAAEHNYFHYLNSEGKHDKSIFFNFNGKGIMTHLYKDKWWYTFAEILSPKKDRLKLFFKFLDYALKNKKHEKIVIETAKEFRKEIIKNIDKKKYRVCSTNYILYWPVFDMDKWSHKLKGKEWKKLRNIRNRFYRKHNIKVVDPRKVANEKLKKVVDEWVKKRGANDDVDHEEYYNMIDNNFKGFDSARTIMVNNEPCAITAGWRIPNSKNYYSSIGIFNYSHTGIGEFANLDDLINLKKKGYKYVDFGGSDKILLSFKKKFKPYNMYKTYTFSIVRKDD